MYIISIVDNFDDGDGCKVIPRITKSEAVHYVIDTLRQKYKATKDKEKRVAIGGLIQCVGHGVDSCGKGNIAYDIVIKEDWDMAKDKEIEKTKHEIKRLQRFITKKKAELAQLEDMGHL